MGAFKTVTVTKATDGCGIRKRKRHVIANLSMIGDVNGWSIGDDSQLKRWNWHLATDRSSIRFDEVPRRMNVMASNLTDIFPTEWRKGVIIKILEKTPIRTATIANAHQVFLLARPLSGVHFEKVRGAYTSASPDLHRFRKSFQQEVNSKRI